MKKVRRKIKWLKIRVLKNPGRMGLLVFLLVGGIIMEAAVSRAEITKQINYQGKLTSASGVAVADGDYAMVIRIYDAASGGSCLWSARGSCGSPTARSVTVENGIFSIMLGDTSAGDNALDMDFNSSYWLGVTVESDSEMSPRKPLGATPYAFNADLMDGLDSAESGADAHILKSDASGNLTGSANLYVAGNVGIGTTSPSYPLSVNGSIQVAGVDGGTNAFILTNGIGAAERARFSADTATGEIRMGSSYSTYWLSLYSANSEAMRIDLSGNVGIGTNNPGARLEVANSGITLPTIDTDTLAVFDRNGEARVSILAANTQYSVLDFGDPQDQDVGYIGYKHSDDSMRFAVNASGEKMIINSSGNVGIGTSSPAAKLHIHESTALGTTQGNYQILDRISGNSNTNTFMQNTWLYRDATASSWTSARLHDAISVDVSFVTPGVDTKVWWERDPNNNVQSWGNAASTYMTLTSTGLGIGTTSPTSLLSVGASSQFQVNSSGAIAAATGITSSGTITLSGLSAGTDNSVIVLNSSNQLVTDEIDSRVWGSSLADGSGTASYVARWTDANTLGTGAVSDNGSTIGVGITADTVRSIGSTISLSDTAGYGIYNIYNFSGTLTAARNNYAAYNAINSSADGSSYSNSLFGVRNDVVNLNGTGYYAAYGAYNYVVNSDATLTNNLSYGAIDYINNASSGTLGTAIGNLGQIINNTTGTITNAYGVDGFVRNDEGIISNARGIMGSVQQAVTGGTVTNAYGGYFNISLTAGTITNGYGVFIGDVNGTNQYGLYQYSSDDINYFAGNVGIGTASPSEPLAIRANGGAANGTFAGGVPFLRLESSGSWSEPMITFAENTNDPIAAIAAKNDDNAAGPLIFLTRPDSGSLTERMRIDGENGYVGLGTISPSVKLDIAQSADSNGILLTGYDDVSSYTGALNIDSYGNFIINSGRYLDIYATSGIRLQNRFITNSHWISGDGGSEGLYVDASGNVGVGTTTMTHKLNVAGTMGASGTIEAGKGSGSVALTINDGYGNANLTFNHAYGTPDVSGSANRIETSVDGTTGYFSFEIGDSVTSGVAVGLTQVMSMMTSAIDAQVNFDANAGLDVTGSLTLVGSASNIALGSNYLSGDGGDEGIFVDSSGNVGIGTSTISAKLDIVNPTAGNGQIGLEVNQATAGNNTSLGLLVNSSDDGNYVKLLQKATTWGAGDLIDANGYFNVKYNGLVGINTTSPSAALSVGGSSSQTMSGVGAGVYLDGADYWGNAKIELRAGGASSNTFIDFLSRNELAYDYRGRIAYGWNIDDGFEFFTNNSGTPRFAIESTGYVGIGTNNPIYELDVRTDIFTTTVYDYGIYVMSADNGSSLGSSIILNRNTNSSTPAAGHARFISRSGGAYYVWPDNVGQLRIGSTGPSYSYDTSGVPVGTQTSWYQLKDNIEAVSQSDRQAALDAVLDADMYNYTMDNGDYPDRHYMGHVIFERDKGSWFSFNDENPAATPVLNERNLFGYHTLAIQELNAQFKQAEAAGFPAQVIDHAVTDADFTDLVTGETTAANGSMALDSQNGRFYFRYNNGTTDDWHYVNQTGGFQIPNYETAPREELDKKAKKAGDKALDFEASDYDDYLTRKLVPGEFLIPYVDEYLEDGAVHGLYARFEDVKGRMFGQEREQLAELAQQSAEQAGQAELLEEAVNENVALLGTNLEEVMEEVDQLEADQEERWDELDILLTKDETKLDEVALLATGNEERIETLEDQMSEVLKRLDGMEQGLAVVDDEEEEELTEDGEEGVFWAFQSAAAALELVAELNDREASGEEIAAAGFFKEKTIAWPSFWNELELASSTHYGEVDLEELDEALEQGSAPILYLSLGNGQEGYYVVVREKDDEDYQVDDPLRDESMELMELREWLEGEAGKTAEMDQLIVYQPAAEKLAGGVGE